jgi:hypothetical protein
MSANKYLPHLLVIPEDDANREIITGFRNHSSVKSHQIQVESVARGWKKAVVRFVEEFAVPMTKKFDMRHVLILIDFDERENRFEFVQDMIPEDLRNRVFIMGCQDEPEGPQGVRTATGLTNEKLGEALAEACTNGTDGVWAHEILAHNLPELQRMRATICRHLMD